MKSDNNWLFDIFLFDIFSFLIPGIVQFDVANYSAKCVFFSFCRGKLQSSIQCL